MSSLHDNNDGRLKHELVTGLCGSVNFKLGQVVEPILIKRCAAAFKYLFAYLINFEYVSGLRVSCKACHGFVDGHSCHDSNEENKAVQFYRLMNTVNKKVLRELFNQVTTEYLGNSSRVCSCILFYKCLTIWRPLMRKQFLSNSIPKGIDRKLFHILQKVIQEWERNGSANQ